MAVLLLSLSGCVGAKNTKRCLLRDVGWCSKEAPIAIRSAVDGQDVLQCSKPLAKCVLHQSLKVTCSSVWLC